MELQLKQEPIQYYSTSAKRTIEERFSHDCVVPDSRRDAADVLLSEADLCLWRLDLTDGSAELEGEVSVQICCLDDLGEMMGFPVSVPIAIRLRDDRIASGQKPFMRCSASDLSVQMINSRKLRITGLIRFVLETFVTSEILVTTAFEEERPGLYSRKAVLTVPSVTAVEEQVFTASETIALKKGVPLEGKLLSMSSVPLTDGCTSSDQRVSVTGRILTTLLYWDERTRSLVTETVETPFSQWVDTGKPCAAFRSSLHLTSEHVQCRNDDPAVDTEFHLVLQIVCCSEAQIESITDAYSNAAPLTMSWEEYELNGIAEAETGQQLAEDTIHCEMSGKEVCAARASFRSESAEITVLLRDENGAIQKKVSKLRLDTQDAIAQSTELPDVRQEADGLRVRLLVMTQNETERSIRLRCLSSAELEEGECVLPSGAAMVRRADEMDLWQLAKENRSSVEAILMANPEREVPYRWILVPHVI